MKTDDLKPGVIVRGPILPEPVEVVTVAPLGGAIKLVGMAKKTGLVHQRVLHADQIKLLEGTPEREPLDGDPVLMTATPHEGDLEKIVAGGGVSWQ